MYVRVAANELPACQRPADPGQQPQWQAHAPDRHVLQGKQVARPAHPLLAGWPIGLAAELLTDRLVIGYKARLGPNVEETAPLKQPIDAAWWPIGRLLWRARHGSQERVGLQD